MIALEMDYKVFTIVILLMLWMMKNEKIKVIFGEIRKIAQVTAIAKMAQAIISYYESKKRQIP